MIFMTDDFQHHCTVWSWWCWRWCWNDEVDFVNKGPMPTAVTAHNRIGVDGGAPSMAITIAWWCHDLGSWVNIAFYPVSCGLSLSFSRTISMYKIIASYCRLFDNFLDYILWIFIAYYNDHLCFCKITTTWTTSHHSMQFECKIPSLQRNFKKLTARSANIANIIVIHIYIYTSSFTHILVGANI